METTIKYPKRGRDKCGRATYVPEKLEIKINFLEKDVYLACRKFLHGQCSVPFTDFMRWMKDQYISFSGLNCKEAL